MFPPVHPSATIQGHAFPISDMNLLHQYWERNSTGMLTFSKVNLRDFMYLLIIAIMGIGCKRIFLINKILTLLNTP